MSSVWALGDRGCVTEGGYSADLSGTICREVKRPRKGILDLEDLEMVRRRIYEQLVVDTGPLASSSCRLLVPSCLRCQSRYPIPG